MENHKKVLGVIFIVSAVLQALLMLVIGALVSYIMGFALNGAAPEDAALFEFILKLIQFLPAIIFIVLILPSLIAGIGLLAKQDWALTMAMIVGCLKLFSFPIGTAIGVYAFWVYFEDKKVAQINPTNP